MAMTEKQISVALQNGREEVRESKSDEGLHSTTSGLCRTRETYIVTAEVIVVTIASVAAVSVPCYERRLEITRCWQVRRRRRSELSAKHPC